MLFVLPVIQTVSMINTVELLKNIPGLSWVPQIPTFLENKTQNEIDTFFTAKPQPKQSQYQNSPTNQATKKKSNKDKTVGSYPGIPESFDWMQERPECVDHVFNMGGCQATQTFSGISVLSDKRCIKKADANWVDYSQQYYINCYNEESCDDKPLSQTDNFFIYLSGYDGGVVPSSCVKYFSGSTGKVSKCPTKCDDGKNIQQLTSIYGFQQTNTMHGVWTGGFDENLKYTMLNGPVQMQFKGYADLAFYNSGIYVHAYGDYLNVYKGEAVGWGEENGIIFWKLKMPFGQQWGEQGFLRIAQSELDQIYLEIYL
ncbi:Cathepsin_B [Hexamita inflata]|uniref:Cathepsin_B n=1 Tax=Hexamita inflata TaxID=28002 RepID=A0ABP1HC77_9EUKA